MFRIYCFLLPLLLFASTSQAKIYNIVDFGATGNGITVNTSEIQSAIDSCALTGDSVFIPSGTFVTGTLFLKSNVTLKLDPSAVLKGSAWLWDYPILTTNFVSSFFTDRALIFSEGATNIKITGTGTIDGSGSSAAFLLPTNKAKRPFGIRLISCSNVIIENVTLKNSAFWMTQFLNCDSVYIHHITLRNHSNSNNDGINIDCSRNVLVENCDVDSFDDAVCLKSSSPVLCENVEVRNCILASYNNVIKLGNETTGGFKNINIHHCKVEYSSFGVGTTAAEAGIGIVIVDGGIMDSVIVSDIDMEGVDTPFFIYLGNYGSKYTSGIPDPFVGKLQHVWLKNITAEAAKNITSWVAGIPGYYAENIYLENIYLKIPGGEPANNIIVPENEKGKARSIMFGEEFPSYGLFIRHVNNISIDNVCVETIDPDSRAFIYTEDIILSPQYLVNTSGTSSCITSQVISGISSLVKEQGSEWNIFPVPASDYISIESTQQNYSDRQLYLYGANGQLIKTIKISNSFNEKISVSDLSDGIYYLRELSDIGPTAGRFIVLKK